MSVQDYVLVLYGENSNEYVCITLAMVKLRGRVYATVFPYSTRM